MVDASEIEDALEIAAGAGNPRLSGGRGAAASHAERYDLANLRRRLLAFLDEVDDGLSVAEVRDALREGA